MFLLNSLDPRLAFSERDVIDTLNVLYDNNRDEEIDFDEFLYQLALLNKVSLRQLALLNKVSLLLPVPLSSTNTFELLLTDNLKSCRLISRFSLFVGTSGKS